MRKRFVVVSLCLSIVIGAIVYHRALAARLPEITTNVDMLDGGHVRLTVLNTTNLPITALAAVGTRTLLGKPITDRSVRFFDSVLDPFGPRELAPGKGYAFNFFGPNPPPDQLRRDVQLKAAILADGSTWGDREWVETLLLRRSSAFHYNSRVLKMIEEASSAGIPRQELAQALTALEKNDLAAAKTTAEKQMIEVAYEEALQLLQDGRSVYGDNAPLPQLTGRARNRLLLRVSRLQASKPVPAN